MPVAAGSDAQPPISDAEELLHVKRRVGVYVSALDQYRQWLGTQRTAPDAASQSKVEEVKAQTLHFSQLFSRLAAEAGMVHPSQGRHLRLKERDVIRALHAYFTLDDGAIEVRDSGGSEGDDFLSRLHHESLPSNMPYP